MATTEGAVETYIRLITFPHEDLAFRAHVTAAQEMFGRWEEAAVLAEVRVAYPRATLRRAAALAALSPHEDTWYAYRDGSIMLAAREEWWHDATLPRTVISPAGEYLDANDAAAELFGVPVEQIRGARIGRFTRHEASGEAGRRAFAVLGQTGSLQSTAVVARPDGADVDIEYRITTSADGTHEMVMRRIAV
jgi:PAS domain-containing protein